MRAWLCVALAASGCGSSIGAGGDDSQADASVNADPDAPTGPSWTTLIQRDWDLGTNQEGFKCRRIKVTEDMYISGFRAMSPTGTYNAVLTVSTKNTPAGDYDCDSGANEQTLLFGGGLQSNDVEFPEGVAVKLTAGTYINLNLHVVNRTDNDAAGTSGIMVKTVPASEVVHEADMMFLGTWDLHIPATSQPWVEPGSCSVPAEWHILNFWPRMHNYATHQLVSIRRNGAQSAQTLLDVDYSAKEQKNYPTTTVVYPNDELRVSCIYVNDTNVRFPPGVMITYGESDTEEMCFTGFYKYPTGGSIFGCAPMQ